MFPNRKMAERELEIAGQLNYGPWTEHSINVGLSVQMIAEKCSNLNPDKAYLIRNIYMETTSKIDEFQVNT